MARNRSWIHTHRLPACTQCPAGPKRNPSTFRPTMRASVDTRDRPSGYCGSHPIAISPLRAAHGDGGLRTRRKTMMVEERGTYVEGDGRIGSQDVSSHLFYQWYYYNIESCQAGSWSKTCLQATLSSKCANNILRRRWPLEKC